MMPFFYCLFTLAQVVVSLPDGEHELYQFPVPSGQRVLDNA